MFDKLQNNSYTNKTYIILIACCVCALTVIGLLMIYSVTSATNIENGVLAYKDVLNQFIFCVIGVLIVLFLSKAKSIIATNTLVVFCFWGVSLLLVLMVPFFGTTVNGATRWLSFGGLTLQPSEFLKIALVVMLTKILSDYNDSKIDSVKAWVLVIFLVIAPLLFLYITQRDLGTTLVCAVALLVVAYMSGVSKVIVFSIFIGGVALVGVLILYGGDFRSGRMNFLDPWNDGEGGYGSGYNIIRSYYAIASGGLFGMGLGNSHEKFDYLYAADNDFIFAVICEELGLVGGIFVLICVIAIFILSIKLASLNSNFESSLAIWGAAMLLLSQSLLNIGCAVGALPTTGKPLPFVSSGGSAVIASFILIGLIFNCALNSKAERDAIKKRDDIRIISRNQGSKRVVRDDEIALGDSFKGEGRSSSRSGATMSRSLNARNSRARTTLKDPSFLDKRK